MIVNIIAGSPFDWEIIKKHPADYTIGVDYGAYQAIMHKVKLDTVFGDFDSVKQDEFDRLVKSCPSIKRYRKEKDNTDTELAFTHALSLKPKIINLFGVTGKRIDHFLGVLFLFKHVIDTDTELYIYDDYNKIYIKKPGKHIIQKTDYQYISFFAYDIPLSLTLTHFKYELNNHLLKNENTLCVSNEFIDNYGIVCFSEGILLIVESHD